MKLNRDNLDKPPRTRKQLKTISVDVYTCPVCGQDLETLGGDSISAPSQYRCETKDCGYTFEEIPY